MHSHHSLDYIEFTTPDMAATKAFFSQAFGWSFTDYAPQYAGISIDGREVGGFALGDVAPGGPLVILYSEDLEASLEAVVRAQGTITKQIFGFPGGRRFHFLEPGGNQLAVWSQPRES